MDSIIKRDETNAAPRKRRIAILKAKGRIPEAIKELTEYLKKSVIKYNFVYTSNYNCEYIFYPLQIYE